MPTANRAKYQIDYSYYNRGKYKDEPKFILNVYTCGDHNDDGNYPDTIYHFDQQYNTISEGINDINHWLQVFNKKQTNPNLKKIV